MQLLFLNRRQVSDAAGVRNRSRSPHAHRPRARARTANSLKDLVYITGSFIYILSIILIVYIKIQAPKAAEAQYRQAAK